MKGALAVTKMLLGSLLLLLFSFPAGAAADMDEFLSPSSCGNGWKLEGKPVFYDRETLSDRIDGEAEIYMPYGFDRSVYVRYASEKRPGAGIDVSIYRMGSLLDAFGMYANYRPTDGRSVAAGAAASLSGSQLFLYQGRYFVEIEITGADTPDQEALADCARGVAARLPGDRNPPPELALLSQPEVVRGTERYLSQSLLGYDFFTRGLTADAAVKGMKLQVFRLLGTTAESATAAFDRYRSQLGGAKVETVGKSSYVEGIDGLYGPAIVLKKGECLAGAIRFTDRKDVRGFLDNVCR